MHQLKNEQVGSPQYFSQIEQLDPLLDHCQIVHLLVGYEFPWDISRALEIALFRTYCVPSISELLDRTGKFHHHPQKRYDDTGLILGEIVKWGYDSDRGRQALSRMNCIHGQFKISNDDFLYVLSTFIYEPVRWIDRFGWRKMSGKERQGFFYFWREVGRRMHIQDIPETYAEFESYNLNYEQQYFRYSDTNRRIGEATRNLLLSWFPKPLRPLVEGGVYTLLDDSLLESFGFPHPNPLARRGLATFLKLRSRAVRFLLPRTKATFFTDLPSRSYPKGYRIADLGLPSRD